MIAKITGVLESIAGSAAMIRMEGGLTYEVLVPAYTAARLGGQLDQPITLFTYYYIEGQMQGSTMTPRLAGFTTPEDRDFFDLFTECKGIGNRKALRAMAIQTSQIAAAIADRDNATLQSLPEVGRRTAETIIATLNGKVDRFLNTSPAAATPGKAAGGLGSEPEPATTGTRAMSKEALAVLLQLGENRVQAIGWIDQAMRDPNNRPGDVQELIARVLRIKEGA